MAVAFPGCESSVGRKKFDCALCKQMFCRSCCKHYLALEGSTQQVRLCDGCFLKNVIWDSSRTYDVHGPPDGKVVVLVHGALVGRQCMVQEARALAAAGYRVIAPDLPAHGARYKEVLTLQCAIDALHEVIIKEAGGQKVVMMGFSMGGYVAAAFAAAHPEVMAGVLLGACAHDAHTRTWRMVGHMANLVYKVCSYKTKSGFVYKTASMDVKRPEVQECFLRAGAEYDAWDSTWRVMYDADMLKLLPKVTCPAMLVVGEKDFRSHEEQFASLLKLGRLIVLEGGEHAFMMQPDVVLQFRKECLPLLEAAYWGPFGSAPPEGGAVEQWAIAVAEAAAARGAGKGTKGKAKAGVGLGTIASSLAAQRQKMDL